MDDDKKHWLNDYKKHWLNGTLVGCTGERFWTSGLLTSPHIEHVTCGPCIEAKQAARELAAKRRAELDASHAAARVQRASARAEPRKPKVSLQDISAAFDRNKEGL